MKHSLAILCAVIFGLGGLTNASAAAPSMDLSHHHHHHWRHHHHGYYWYHHHHHRHHRW